MTGFQILFLVLSIISPIIPLWVGRNEKKSLLWIHAATGISFDILINIERRLLHGNYYWLANLFVIAEFLIISAIYRHLFSRNTWLFCGLLAMLSVYFCVATIHTSVWKFNTSGASVFYFTYVVYAILGLYRMLTEQKFMFLDQSREFWVHCAFLIYGSGNFLLFLFSDYLMASDNSMFKLLWSLFFLTINITLNILLAIALSRKILPQR